MSREQIEKQTCKYTANILESDQFRRPENFLTSLWQRGGLLFFIVNHLSFLEKKRSTQPCVDCAPRGLCLSSESDLPWSLRTLTMVTVLAVPMVSSSGNAGWDSLLESVFIYFLLRGGWKWIMESSEEMWKIIRNKAILCTSFGERYFLHQHLLKSHQY